MAEADDSETELVLLSHERCDPCAEFRSRINGTDVRYLSHILAHQEPYIVEIPTDFESEWFPPRIDIKPEAKGHDEVKRFLDEFLS